MMRLTLLAVLLMCAAPLSTARAGEAEAWASSFSPATLAPHLGDAPARYLVVPAGSEAPELTEAREALASALRASGKAQLVMDAQALGPVATLDDATIARKSANLPVDRVMVVRLFPDATGALTQAVVTVYDTAAQPLGSFSTTKATALAAAPQEQEPVVEAPPPAQARPVPPPDAREQYEQRAIGFDDYLTVRVSTAVPWASAEVSRWSLPYEGKYKKPLEGDAFYRKVGREDLVEAYAGRMRMKTVLGVIGGAAMLGGGFVAYQGFTGNEENCQAGTPGFRECFDREMEQADRKFVTVLIGTGIFSAGAGLIVGAVRLTPHPVTPHEARQLADVYNKQLQADLGLSEQPAPEPRKRPGVIQASLTPMVGPQGGGLLLNGSF
ncbi:hypothetical protein [Pyxidicoccus xibeiensis]|uniref:hypothetical protein n=1 Tax=Pyxidicoccus xibeiensis TaxID=2906759 RepID=UPI0020A799E4|nr:hypothetical protein [Pyxidicoccus xibeiensis]MCP3138186.1 hypothetical protein [Pyxidicoccus xibeiensis]